MIDHNHSARHPQEEEEHLSLESLPSDILVLIGQSVEELCGLHDFVHLSSASKRLKKLLIPSEEAISDTISNHASLIRRLDMIEVFKDEIDDPSQLFCYLLANVDPTILLPYYASSPIIIRNLRQLGFYKSVGGYISLKEIQMYGKFSLLNANLILFKSDDCNIDILRDMLMAVRRVLNKHPSASVILEAHCSRLAPTEDEWEISKRYGERVRDILRKGIRREPPQALPNHTNTNNTNTKDLEDVMAPISEDRFHIRTWGKAIAEAIIDSGHPYKGISMVYKCGWVEVFLRMEDRQDPESSELLLPPRPNYYDHVAITPREFSAGGGAEPQ